MPGRRCYDEGLPPPLDCEEGLFLPVHAELLHNEIGRPILAALGEGLFQLATAEDQLPLLGRTTQEGCRLDVHENQPIRRDLLDVVPIQPDVVSSRKKSREIVRSVRVRASVLEFNSRTDDAIHYPGRRAMPLVDWGNGGLRLGWRVNNEQSRDDGDDDSQTS